MVLLIDLILRNFNLRDFMLLFVWFETMFLLILRLGCLFFVICSCIVFYLRLIIWNCFLVFNWLLCGFLFNAFLGCCQLFRQDFVYWLFALGCHRSLRGVLRNLIAASFSLLTLIFRGLLLDLFLVVFILIIFSLLFEYFCVGPDWYRLFLFFSLRWLSQLTLFLLLFWLSSWLFNLASLYFFSSLFSRLCDAFHGYFF